MRRGASEATTRSLTVPRPPGIDTHCSRAPFAGQAPRWRSTCLKPSMNAGHRATSVHSRHAASASTCAPVRRLIVAIDLAHDLVDRARDRLQERPDFLAQAAVLLLPLGCERVVPATAALGVLPAPLDQALALELAQERVHRVGVHREHALGELGDPVHELVPVRRAAGHDVHDEKRKNVTPPQLSTEGIAWPLPPADGLADRRLGVRELRRLRDGAPGYAAGLALSGHRWIVGRAPARLPLDERVEAAVHAVGTQDDADVA